MIDSKVVHFALRFLVPSQESYRYIYKSFIVNCIKIMKPLSKLVKNIIELETCNVALQPILFWSTSIKVHSRVQEVKIFKRIYEKTRLVTTGDIANHRPVLDEANWDRFGSRQDVKSWRSWKTAKQFLTLINLNVTKNKLYFLTYFLLPYCLVQRLQPGFVCFSLA